MKPLVCIFTLLAAMPAFGFIFVKGDNAVTYAKGERKISQAPLWTGKTLNFYVNTTTTALGGGAFPATLTGADILASATTAAAVWNSVNCRTGATVKVLGTTSGTFSTADSQNVIAWDDRVVGSSYCGSAGQLACAGSAIVNDLYVDCDISINGSSNVTLDITGSASSYHLTTILIHEMGHCLGIDHPYQTASPVYLTTNSYLLSSIMKPALSAGSVQTTLDQDEKDALQCVYANASDPTRNPCGSYHGTSGNGQIADPTVGGPSARYTPVCTNDTGQSATSTIQNGSESAGCITSAFASPGELTLAKGFFWFSGWVPLLLAIGFVRLRRRRL